MSLVPTLTAEPVAFGEIEGVEGRFSASEMEGPRTSVAANEIPQSTARAAKVLIDDFLHRIPRLPFNDRSWHG